jgi:predicted membrane chloride channel (bestrophin family)
LGCSYYNHLEGSASKYGSNHLFPTKLVLILIVDVHPIVATVLVVLVGFALNLRSSMAYEQYMKGQKVWSDLTGISATLARCICLLGKE